MSRHRDALQPYDADRTYHGAERATGETRITVELSEFGPTEQHGA